MDKPPHTKEQKLASGGWKNHENWTVNSLSRWITLLSQFISHDAEYGDFQGKRKLELTGVYGMISPGPGIGAGRGEIAMPSVRQWAGNVE
jgi:hypothetical protein